MPATKTKIDSYRIKIGYVSASIKSKALIYLIQDLFRFHDKNKFEVFIFAVTPNDSHEYISQAMRGRSNKYTKL